MVDVRHKFNNKTSVPGIMGRADLQNPWALEKKMNSITDEQTLVDLMANKAMIARVMRLVDESGVTLNYHVLTDAGASERVLPPNMTVSFLISYLSSKKLNTPFERNGGHVQTKEEQPEP